MWPIKELLSGLSKPISTSSIVLTTLPSLSKDKSRFTADNSLTVSVSTLSYKSFLTRYERNALSTSLVISLEACPNDTSVGSGKLLTSDRIGVLAIPNNLPLLLISVKKVISFYQQDGYLYHINLH